MFTPARRVVLCLLLAILAIVPLGLSGCGRSSAASASSEPELTYTVSACQERISPDQLDSWAKIEVRAENGSVQVEQNLSYVCCARVELSLERSGNLLKLVETNKGEMCRCMCGYTVQAQITGLPKGTYQLEVWGVIYEDVEPEMLGKESVTI